MYLAVKTTDTAHGFSVRLHQESDTDRADDEAVIRSRRRSNNQNRRTKQQKHLLFVGEA